MTIDSLSLSAPEETSPLSVASQGYIEREEEGERRFFL
jgi:hypothetical protein